MFSDNLIIVTVLEICIFPLVVYFIVKKIQGGGRKKREEQALKIAKRLGIVVRPYFGKFFKDCGDMSCFLQMLNPSFCNVIERLDKENGDVYVGELQWETAVKRNKRRYGRRITFSDFMPSGSPEDNYVRIPKDNTLCVLYDDGFNLPSFDLSRETLKDKATEVLGMNETEDIDFDDDKEFSSAWWLSSDENMIVRDLFTKSIRSNFMKFVDKGYRICGRRNVLLIITDKVYWPEDYSKVTSDIRVIQRFMKNNKKFYTPYSERQSASE